MGKGRRDWRAYGRFRQDDEALFLRKARSVVWGMHAHWAHGKGGRPPSHNPRALVVCLLLMRELRRDFRGMVSHLRARGDPDALELRKAPGKSLLHRAAMRLSERYLRMVNEGLVEPFKRGAWPWLRGLGTTHPCSRGSSNPYRGGRVTSAQTADACPGLTAT